MKTREQRIARQLGKCQHFNGVQNKVCRAGVSYSEYRQGCIPCLGGNTHSDFELTFACSKWLRITRDQAEASADRLEESDRKYEIIAPVVIEWREKKPIGKAEVITCPACNGKLHLSQSPGNGHVHGHCETQGCVRWME